MRPLSLAVASAFLLAAPLGYRRFGRQAAAAAVAAALVLGGYGLGLFDLPGLEAAVAEAGARLGGWTYAVVGAMTFLESAAFLGIVFPGETTLALGGLIAGQGEVRLDLLVPLAWTCALTGDVTSYVVGRRLGGPAIRRRAAARGVAPERLERVEELIARRGGVVVLVGHFVGFVQATAPFAAGAARMPFRAFLAWAAVGTGLWTSAYLVLGYALWEAQDEAFEDIRRVGWVVTAAVLALLAAAGLWVSLRRRRRRRDGADG